VVEVDDVSEALRLMDVSKASLVESSSQGHSLPVTARIYEIIRDMAKSAEDEDELLPELHFNQMLERVIHKGFTEPQLMECIREYEELNVWQLNTRGTKLTFVTG
jgi:DNA replication licensing factor MCM7